jgi:hypothetical protein
MKLRHCAALTFLCFAFQPGQANALGWKECYSQAQCGPKEFCGVAPDKDVGACQASDSWPLTPAPTTDPSTGVYGSSVVQGGCCGTERAYPPGWTPEPTPAAPDLSGPCVTITKASSASTESNQVFATAVCNKWGNYRIALPPGDYLLKSSRTNKSEKVRVKIGFFN